MKIIFYLIFFITSSCSNSVRGLDTVRENVLIPDREAIISNKYGTVSYSYSGEKKRTVKFEGNSKVFNMIPRSNRFLGQLGLYNPGERWLSLGGSDSRFVIIEAELHFEKMEDALNKLREGSAVMKWQTNEQGYVGGLSISPQRNQINITLHRYYLNGSPIKNLPRGDGTIKIN